MQILPVSHEWKFPIRGPARNSNYCARDSGMGSSNGTKPNDPNILYMIPKESRLQKRYHMFEQLVLVATAVENDLLPFGCYNLSEENPPVSLQDNGQREYSNTQMR